jgi:exosortase A-associated hydrolase 2
VNPFFFGTGQRRLFGIYEAGTRGAIVLCHPFGQEYLRAHRSTRQLASQLVRAGFHVLRFDYFGTGDSGGDMTDGDLARWQGDVETAIDELKDTSGQSQVTLIGLRLGAALAAATAVRRSDVERLVLWDPVVSGEPYLSELARMSSIADWTSVLTRPHEILGFVLTPQLANQIRAVDLLKLVPQLPQRTLTILSDSVAAQGGLADLLRARGAPPLEHIPSEPSWLENKNTGVGAIPANVLQRIVAWLG